MLLLSFAFLIVPNFNPFRESDSMEEMKSIPIPGKSRNLLHKGVGDLAPSDTDNPYGITVRPPVFWQQAQSPAIPSVNKAVVDLEIDGDEVKKDPPVDQGGKDKIVYVQIEQSVEESNVTYVTSEEYNTDHNYDSSHKAVPAGGEQGNKLKKDL